MNFAIITIILFPATVKKRASQGENYLMNEIYHNYDQIKDVSYEIFKENNI